MLIDTLAIKSNRWRETRRAIRFGFRVQFSRRATGHTHGGERLHGNAVCAGCRKPLRLVWDINLQDPSLTPLLPEILVGQSRLPLYYCFNCPEATWYRISSGGQLKVFGRHDDRNSSETLYGSERVVPEILPRRHLKLSKLPSLIDGLICLETSLSEIDPSGLEFLSQYLGNKVEGACNLKLSQFGGSPRMIQGHMDHCRCINPKCRSQRYRSWPAFCVKEIAYVERDGLDGFEWAYAPLTFHICWVCGAIRGDFQCD
jgi:hypothetical protein